MSEGSSFTHDLIQRSISWLATFVTGCEYHYDNQLSTVLLTIGQSFGLTQDDKSGKWLRLFEAALQGIFDYEVRNFSFHETLG